MKRVLFFLLVILVAAESSYLLVRQDALHGDFLRDFISFILYSGAIITGIYTIKWKLEELEDKRSLKRDFELYELEYKTRKEIEAREKETA